MSKGKGKFILGALAGIAAGILLAPKSGEKTREELKVKLNDLLKKAKFSGCISKKSFRRCSRGCKTGRSSIKNFWTRGCPIL